MNKTEILDNLEDLTEEETVKLYGRAVLADWWTILYGQAPPKSRTGLQLACDMHQMLRACRRARALSRGLMPY